MAPKPLNAEIAAAMSYDSVIDNGEVAKLTVTVVTSPTPPITPMTTPFGCGSQPRPGATRGLNGALHHAGDQFLDFIQSLSRTLQSAHCMPRAADTVCSSTSPAPVMLGDGVPDRSSYAS